MATSLASFSATNYDDIHPRGTTYRGDPIQWIPTTTTTSGGTRQLTTNTDYTYWTAPNTTYGQNPYGNGISTPSITVPQQVYPPPSIIPTHHPTRFPTDEELLEMFRRAHDQVEREREAQKQVSDESVAAPVLEPEDPGDRWSRIRALNPGEHEGN